MLCYPAEVDKVCAHSLYAYPSSLQALRQVFESLQCVLLSCQFVSMAQIFGNETVAGQENVWFRPLRHSNL